MKERVLLSLKTAWLTAAVMVFFIDINWCLSTEESCRDASETMLLLMFWLTFPSGILSLIFSLPLISGDPTNYPSDYILVWLIMFSAGCIQWFVLLPRLFTKPQFTVLDLGVKVAQPINIADVQPVAQVPVKQIPIKSEAARKRALRRRQKSNERVAPFDSRGRTPLERAMLPRL